MAQWQKKKVDESTINGGNQYTTDSQLSVQALNSVVESGLYAQEFVNKLASNTPVVNSSVGTPRVELIDDGNGYKKFAFYNIKGDTGSKGPKGAAGIGIKSIVVTKIS